MNTQRPTMRLLSRPPDHDRAVTWQQLAGQVQRQPSTAMPLLRAWLVNSSGQKLCLDGSTSLTCGRAHSNDLVLSDASVSPRHVRFERWPEGYAVINLDSTNGMVDVNDEEVATGHSRLLRNGDRLTIGAFAFTFRSGLRKHEEASTTRLEAGGTHEPTTTALLVGPPEIAWADGVIYARLRLSGTLNDETFDALQQSCYSVINRNIIIIFIHAARLDYVDDSGLLGLASLQRRLEGCGGSITLIAPGSNVRRTIDKLNVATVLPMHADERQAVAATSGSARLSAPAQYRNGRQSGLSRKRAMASIILSSGQEWPLTEDTLTIGRDIGNHLLVDDPYCSRQHAVIIRVSDHYVLLDCGSKNGTFVNGRRIRDLHVLYDGDQIQAAAGRFRFHAATASYRPTALVTCESPNGASTSSGLVDPGVLLCNETLPADEAVTIDDELSSWLASERAKAMRVGKEYVLLDLCARAGVWPNERRVHELNILSDRTLAPTEETRFILVRQTTRTEQTEPEAPMPFIFADPSGRRWVRIRNLTTLLSGSVFLLVALCFWLLLS